MLKKLMYHPESETTFIGGSEHDYHHGCIDVTPSQFPAGHQYPCGNYVSTIMPSFDFETYSEAGYVIDERTGKVRGLSPQGKGGLPVVGTPVYAEHPSTRVVCLYYDLKDGKGNRGWIPGTPTPHDLLDHIANIRPIEAWNITFEWYIWNMICVRQFGWPPLQLDQCYCAMAKSRRHSMPGGLGNCAKVLGTPLKDKEGTRLINKLSRPVSATKNRPLPYWDFTNAWDDYVKFYSYCADDVRAEDGAAALIPDLTPYERATWLTDQTINARGVRVDMVALHAMQRIMTEMFVQYVAELTRITNGVVDSASKVAALGKWLETQGTYLPDMTADSVEEALAEDSLPQGSPARRALEIRSILSSANIKKIPTLLLRVSSDGRLRDQYSYCGADRTGRFSSGGCQLQNITAKGPNSAFCEGCDKHFNPRDLKGCPRCGSTMFHKKKEWKVEAVMDAKQDLSNNDLAFIEHVWGDPATVLCGCLRGLFVAKEGTRFICCDFSAIEAVIAACLARCQWRIEVFETHGLIYEMSASKITGTPLDVYMQYKKDNDGFNHPDRKKIGKVAELGSGFGGWIGAYRNFGAEGTDEEIKAQVLAWREASPEIVEMWGGQFRQTGAKPWNARPELYGLEGMAIMAILNPGQQYWYNDIAYHVHQDILYCRLPSGRFLTYHRPRLIDGDDKLKRGPCYKILFEGWNSNSQKGKIGWHVLETYGGRLFENVCQAIGADLQCEALVRLEQRAYPVAMHTHDEAISEMQYGFGSIEEMCDIMSERPEWCQWWPIKAAGWEHCVYQKD